MRFEEGQQVDEDAEAVVVHQVVHHAAVQAVLDLDAEQVVVHVVVAHLDVLALPHVDAGIGLRVDHLVVRDRAMVRHDREETVFAVAVGHVLGQREAVDAREVHAVVGEAAHREAHQREAADARAQQAAGRMLGVFLRGQAARIGRAHPQAVGLAARVLEHHRMLRRRQAHELDAVLAQGQRAQVAGRAFVVYAGQHQHLVAGLGLVERGPDRLAGLHDQGLGRRGRGRQQGGHDDPQGEGHATQSTHHCLLRQIGLRGAVRPCGVWERRL